MRSTPGVLLAIAALVTACAPIRTEPAPARPDPLLDYVDQAVSTERFRGAVEVRDGTKVLLRRGFGLADPVNEVRNGPNTRFRIASVSKQFTALAVLRLREQGRLNVVDGVCSYLSNCPPAWAPITIDQLLTHTSGLHDFADETAGIDQFYATIGTRQPTPEQLLGHIATLPTDFAPGTRWAYSNSGYVLLGALVERVSGMSYGQFLHDEVLDPLGLSDTGYQPGLPPGEDYAVGYTDWTTPAQVLDDSVFYAAGGMYSTVTDLGRWQRFLLTGDPPVVRRETLAELLRPRVQANSTTWYGYGIQFRGASTATVDAYSHAGGLPGFTSYVEAHPSSGVTVTVLANIELDVEDFGRTLAGLALGQR
ncbi:serine hydrolase domain-containing protein [Actinophytocola oryzae]|uniref:CubicO group peptidase (Beta-lactamase class C family) n=1 Tax=Actinophytocola oryzae TaxID=502181 RepID=A0A4R7VXQ6_9PSEU|nr:serine hydrolase domain-containing protein [Actinophytocola oryzae]TDV54933.1 CubicO group peptidase (beta-lactamase class C family) [Actinophytocola oryzae]